MSKLLMVKLLILSLQAVLVGSLASLWMTHWSAAIGCSLIGVPVLIATWRLAQ